MNKVKYFFAVPYSTIGHTDLLYLSTTHRHTVYTYIHIYVDVICVRNRESIVTRGFYLLLI